VIQALGNHMASDEELEEIRMLINQMKKKEDGIL
jgi:hypothetical protein